LGLAGESGSGKSVTSRALMGLLPRGLTSVEGSIQFAGTEMLGLTEQEWRKYRGGQIAMIYQDTMRSLNPIMTIGEQISEAIRLHEKVTRKEARRRSIELLDLVRIPLASERYSNYPHQLSGGMRQRVMIAMALSSAPKLLIADEPTTALDATTQAQILRLLNKLQSELQMAVIFITHDLHLAATFTDEVAVMYAGKIVERARSSSLMSDLSMPYARALIEAIPQPTLRSHSRLPAVPGRPPDPSALPNGCRFHPRCPVAIERCASEQPELLEVEPQHWSACWNPVSKDSR
jgi:oligopeptide/dipeptide ABC transporter ATP-binding protein